MWDQVKDVVNHNDDVILPKERALSQSGGVVVLKGNLAPKGAVLKPSAASPHLMVHRGRAVVFEDIDDYKAKINDEALDIDETCVMVLKNCGPKGYPGMAEVGNMGLPPKVLRKGITDMVRISDARMSGTAYGTVCLHTSPRGRCWWPAGRGAKRRLHRAGCAEPSPAPRYLGSRIGSPSGRLDPQARGRRVGLYVAPPDPCAGRRHRGPTSTS